MKDKKEKQEKHSKLCESKNSNSRTHEKIHENENLGTKQVPKNEFRLKITKLKMNFFSNFSYFFGVSFFNNMN